MPLISGTNQASTTILGPIGAPRLNRGALAPLGTTNPLAGLAAEAEESLTNERIIQAAEAAGAAEIERDASTGIAILPESQGNFTVFDKNYNQAIRIKYLSELDRDTTKTLDGIFASHDRKEISLSVATGRANDHIKALENNVDPSVRVAAVKRASEVARALTRPAQRRHSEIVVQEIIVEATRSVAEFVEDAIKAPGFGKSEQDILKKDIEDRLTIVYPNQPELVKSKIESAYVSVLNGRWRHLPFKSGDIQNKRKFLDFLHKQGGPDTKSFTAAFDAFKADGKTRDTELYDSLSNFHTGFEKISYENQKILSAFLEKQFIGDRQKQNDAANVGTLGSRHIAAVRSMASFSKQYGTKIKDDPLYKAIQKRIDRGFETPEDANRATSLIALLTAVQNDELLLNPDRLETLLDRFEAVINASHEANPNGYGGMTPTAFKEWRKRNEGKIGIAEVNQRIDDYVKAFALHDKAATRRERVLAKAALNEAASIKFIALEKWANEAMAELAEKDGNYYPEFATFIHTELKETYPQFKTLPNHIKLSIFREEIGRKFRDAHTKITKAITKGQTAYNHAAIREAMLTINEGLSDALPDHVIAMLRDDKLTDSAKTRILNMFASATAAERRAEMKFNEYREIIAKGDKPEPTQANMKHASRQTENIFPLLVQRGEPQASWLSDAVLQQTKKWKIVPWNVSKAINDLAGSGKIEDLKDAYRAYRFLNSDPNLPPSLDKSISKGIRDKFAHIKQFSNSDEAFNDANKNSFEVVSGYTGKQSDFEKAMALVIKKNIDSSGLKYLGRFPQSSPNSQSRLPGLFLKRVKDYHHQFVAINYSDHSDISEIEAGLQHAWETVSNDGGWSLSKLDPSIPVGGSGMVHRSPELVLRDIKGSSEWVTPVLERFVNANVLRVGAENVSGKSQQEKVEGSLANQTRYQIENLRISRTNNDELKFRIFSRGENEEGHSGLVQLYRKGEGGDPPVPLVIDFAKLKAERNQIINTQELELSIAKKEKAEDEARQRQRLFDKKRNPPETSQSDSVRKGLDLEKQNMEKAIELGEDEIKLLERENSFFGLVNNSGKLSLRDESAYRAVRDYMTNGISKSDKYFIASPSPSQAFTEMQASRHSTGKTVPLRPTRPEDLENFRISQRKREDQPFVWSALQEVSP